MALKSELMAGGLPYALANKLGFEPLTAYTAAGTTQGTATALVANNANVTTSSIGGGVIMVSPNQKYMVYNAGPNVLTVYPPVGNAFAGLATNAGVQVAPLNSVRTDGADAAGITWVTS